MANLLSDEEIAALLGPSPSATPNGPTLMSTSDIAANLGSDPVASNYVPIPNSAPVGTPSLADLYGSDLSDEKLKEISNPKKSAGSYIGNALSGLGDAISQSVGIHQNTLGESLESEQQKKRQAIADFLNRRKGIEEGAKFGIEQGKAKHEANMFPVEESIAKVKGEEATSDLARLEREKDPNSEESKLAQDYMKSITPGKDYSGTPASVLKQYMGPSLSKYEADVKAKEANARLIESKAYRDTSLGVKEREENKKWNDDYGKAVQPNEEALTNIDAAGGFLKEAVNGNQAAQKQLGALIQRAATGSKRAGGPAAEMFSGGTSIGSRLEEAAEKALQGKLDPTLGAELAQNLIALKKANQDAKQRVGERLAKQRATGNKLDVPSNYKMITGEDYNAPNNNVNMTSTSIRRQDPKSGKIALYDPVTKAFMGWE